jgi:ketosteroid isomerase-like protein
VGCHASVIGNRPHPLKPPSPEGQSIAVAFNEAINRRDLHALGRLMTDDHTFIDPDDNVIAGKGEVLTAWEGFFDAFPDYRNHWSRVISTGDALTAVGRTVCSNEPALNGPAIWTARVEDDKVSEWRVYEDTPANRARLGVADEDR